MPGQNKDGYVGNSPVIINPNTKELNLPLRIVYLDLNRAGAFAGVPAQTNKEVKMHYHCEIIMPNTKNIGKAIETIMEPFSEHEGDIGEITGHEFWDFYVIGGRWAGVKEMCGYSNDKIKAFYEALKTNKITVSGLQMGKQTIYPASQIPIVDQLWHDFFPTESGEIMSCPIFDHSNDPFDSDDLLGCDICLVEEIPEKLTCSRVIIAGPSYNNTTMKAHFMLCDSQWNGLNWMPIDWDKKVKTAIKMFEKGCNHYKDEWRDKVLPKPNWICVTVDYHS